MYYTYILQSEKDHKYYIESKKDIRSRIDKHNKGYVRSKKSRIPIMGSLKQGRMPIEERWKSKRYQFKSFLKSSNGPTAMLCIALRAGRTLAFYAKGAPAYGGEAVNDGSLACRSSEFIEKRRRGVPVCRQAGKPPNFFI